jgi:hypothetical protein
MANSIQTGDIIDLSSLKDTQTFFNNYYLPALTVSQDVDDATLGFFQTVTGSVESAKALASAVILTSISQKVDPMEILDKFKKMSNGELNSYLTMFLNLSRVGTSYLGITNAPKVNKYIERMIRA